MTQIRIVLAICTFAAVPSATAQIVSPPAINVNDISEEARNAYQEACSISSNLSFRSCQFPPLPPGKRLALRGIQATCSVNAARVAGIQIVHELSDSTSQTGGFSRFRASLLQAFGTSGERVLSEPMYAHSDTAPRLDLFLRDDGTTNFAVCSFSLRGYLVNK